MWESSFSVRETKEERGKFDMAAETTDGTIIRTTMSPCPECKKFVPSDMVHRDGSLYMVRRCGEHGAHELLYMRNFRFFEKISSIVHCVEYDDQEPEVYRKLHAGDVSIIFIDLTDKCNLTCPVCYADSGGSGEGELTKEEIFERLSDVKGKKPNIYLSGGEPTLRDDVLDLLSGLTERGFNTFLLTNGVKLADETFVQRLADAGLKYLVMQFDGFTDDVHERLRGKKLLDVKLKALDNLANHGISATICMMVMRGVNDHQIGDYIRFGLERDFVSEVEFMPAVSQGRAVVGDESLDMEADEIMDCMEAQTGGRVGQDDFVKSMKTIDLLYQTTRKAMFRCKRCTFECPVVGNAKDFVPVVRLINPVNVLKNPKVLKPVGFMAKNFLNLLPRKYPQTLTFIQISRLFSLNTLTSGDIGVCNIVYMTKEGFVPGCLYNLIMRKSCL